LIFYPSSPPTPDFPLLFLLLLLFPRSFLKALFCPPFEFDCCVRQNNVQFRTEPDNSKGGIFIYKEEFFLSLFFSSQIEKIKPINESEGGK